MFRVIYKIKSIETSKTFYNQKDLTSFVSLIKRNMNVSHIVILTSDMKKVA